MAGGQARDDDRGGLQAGVAADGRDHRREGHGDEIYRRIVCPKEHQDGGRDAGPHQGGQQPRHADARRMKRRETLQLARVRAGHRVQVLHRLFLSDLDDAVRGDLAHEPVTVVEDRHGNQIVLAEDIADLLLVHVGGYVDRIRVDEVSDPGRLRAGQQQPQPHVAEKPPVLVHDVDGVEILINLGGPDLVDGLRDRRVLRHADGHRLHDPAGRVRGVAHQLADFQGVITFETFYDFFGHLFGHLGQQVGRIVVVQLGDDILDLALFEQLEQFRPRRLVDLFEYLRRLVGVQQVEDQPPPLVIDGLHDLRDVTGPLLSEPLAQRGTVLGFEQRLDVLQQVFLFFRHWRAQTLRLPGPHRTRTQYTHGGRLFTHLPGRIIEHVASDNRFITGFRAGDLLH